MAQSEHGSGGEQHGHDRADKPEDRHETRPEPERGGPDRAIPSFSDRLRVAGRGRRTRGGRSAAGGSSGRGSFGGGASPVEQVMADTVRTGYEVIEENIRHGRQAAERLRLGTYRSEDLPDDMAMVVNRLLRLGMDLSTTWFQLIAAVLRDPRLATAFESTGGGSTAAARPPARSTVRRPPRIHYRVRCSRPYDIEFIPHELSGPTLPVVAGLYAPDRGHPPSMSVLSARSTAAWRLLPTCPTINRPRPTAAP